MCAVVCMGCAVICMGCILVCIGSAVVCMGCAVVCIGCAVICMGCAIVYKKLGVSACKELQLTIIVLNYHDSCRIFDGNVLIICLHDNINEFRLLQDLVIDYGNEPATGGG